MKTIKTLVDYTKSKKKYQLEKKDYFYIEPIKDIEEYIRNEKSVAGIGLALDFISSWFHYNYIYSFLTTTDSATTDLSSLAKSTLLGIEANNWDFFLGKNHEKYHSAIPFQNAIKHLSQALLLGWDTLAINYGKLLINMLYGKQYKGWHSAYKHAWFMLEIFCKWQGIELNYSRLNYPEDMKVYAQALQHWDTNDNELLSKLVNELVDFHIAESDEYERKNHIPDFSSADYFIFPVEILLWLNIRERMNFAKYIPNNDLLKMSINNWQIQKVAIPVIEVVEKAKTKLLSEYPNTHFDL